MSAEFLTEKSGVVWVCLRVQPRASRDEIVGVTENELRVRIAAPPVDDAANRAVIRLIAKTVGCARGRVRIVRGEKSRHKILSIEGVPIEPVRERLAS